MRDKIKYRLRILSQLCPYAAGVKKFLLVNLAIGISVMALGFIQPLFYKLFIDRVILNRELSLMPFVAIGYLSAFVFNLLLSYLKNYSTNRLVNRVNLRVKMKILRGFFSGEFSSYDLQSVGDMKMRLEDDTSCIASYAGAQSVDYLIAYVTLIMSALLLFLIEWRLAIFSCITIPMNFWLDHIIAKREKVVQNNQRENDQKMSSWLHACVQGWREIKALNLQKHEERQFAWFIHQYAIYFGSWIYYWVVRVLVIPKIKEEFLMKFSLYFLGGLLIINGHFEIGALLVFMQYYNILSNAIQTISGTDAELLVAKPQSERMLEELNRKSARLQGILHPGNSNSIVFDNVSFSYSNMKDNVVSNLSFRINDGDRVAITGKSGAGKTTVLKLLMGLLYPVSGTILFSDMDLSRLSLESVHQRIGFVMQDNILFNTSIKDNLRYGKENATDEELKSVCQKAYIYDYIKELPEGFNTIIGERGIKLSGGQKQRLVLARLFLRDVNVYIFDEATSALDQYSESIIQDAIKSLGKDKTIIVVAHRQGSLSLCDRIITL